MIKSTEFHIACLPLFCFDLFVSWVSVLGHCPRLLTNVSDIYVERFQFSQTVNCLLVKFVLRSIFKPIFKLLVPFLVSGLISK